MSNIQNPDNVRYFYILSNAMFNNYSFKSCGYRLAGTYAYELGKPVTPEMVADAWARMYSAAPGMKIMEENGKCINMVSHEIPGRVPEANGVDQGRETYLNFRNWHQKGKETVWIDEEFVT